MSKKIDAGTAGLYSYKPKSPAPGNGLAAQEPLATTEPDKSAQGTIEDKLRRQIDILIQHYGAEAKGHLYSKRKAIREPYLDKIMAIITTETTKARIQELQTLADMPPLTKSRYLSKTLDDRLNALQEEQNK